MKVDVLYASDKKRHCRPWRDVSYDIKDIIMSILVFSLKQTYYGATAVTRTANARHGMKLLQRVLQR